MLRLVILLLSISVAAAGMQLYQACAQVNSGGEHVLNLSDVELSTLIDDVAMVTGYTFIIHPDVNGRVTINSQTSLSTEDLFQVFLATLRVQGFTATPSGRGIYRIVPENIGAGEGALGTAGQSGFKTKVYNLEHFSAVEAAKMVKPLLGAQGRVVANPLSNILIVVEYGSNMDVVDRIVAQVDRDRSVTQTIALKNLPVSEVQEIINAVEVENDQGGGRQTLSVIASSTSNSVILRGEPAAVSRAAKLIKELDTTSPLSKETRVITLSHEDAVLMEPILRQIAEGGGGDNASVGGVPTVISVHEPTNSIVVSASPDTVSNIEAIIRQLDARRRQVLVEAIIVEVSDSTARELGLQFLVTGSDGDIPFVSSTFSNAAPNVLALTGALTEVDLSPGDGSNTDSFEEAAISSLLGLNGGTFGFGGQSGDTIFGVVLNALETDDESNILSTPSIMTLDNNTSRIAVGQEIPITSGEVLGDANVNPFRTVERREVGIILSVTPRVGEDGTVRLDIEQEVSSIDAAIGTEATPDFILDQRDLTTSVVVDDGDLVVLGGLIEASDVVEREKIPLLGDIPGVGRLFQNEQIGRAKTNLMIFIRPTIVSNKDDVQAVTNRNFNFIRNQQIIANEGGPSSLDQYVRELLQAEPPPLDPDGPGSGLEGPK
ncbi:MAG: type II secretion system secretin GspD [Pseudomonadota bacterium]